MQVWIGTAALSGCRVFIQNNIIFENGLQLPNRLDSRKLI